MTAADIVEQLRRLTQSLEDHIRSGRPLDTVAAASGAHLLPRLIANPKFLALLEESEKLPRTRETEIKEFSIALHYDLLRKLKVRGAAKFVARAYDAAYSSVKTYSARHRADVLAWNERMKMNVRYDGLSLESILREELNSLGFAIPSKDEMVDEKRKKPSTQLRTRGRSAKAGFS
jgi:hypothetical protein